MGAGGQLGRELMRVVRSAGLRPVGLAHSDLDVTDRTRVLQTVAAMTSDSDGLEAVINAAAYTRVDEAESQDELAFKVNRDGAANVAEAAYAAGVPVIHFSTDYVFDGSLGRPYSEDDPPSPVNVYGWSKLHGERAVSEVHPRHIILRTSWLFASHGNNFVSTILRLSRESAEIRVVADQFGCPTPAAAAATATLRICRMIADDSLYGKALGVQGEEPVPWGLYHYAGLPPVSWASFATAVLRVGCIRRDSRLVPIASAELHRPAQRPSYSVLDGSKIQRSFGIEAPSWEDGLKEVISTLCPSSGQS